MRQSVDGWMNLTPDTAARRLTTDRSTCVGEGGGAVDRGLLQVSILVVRYIFLEITD